VVGIGDSGMNRIRYLIEEHDKDENGIWRSRVQESLYEGPGQTLQSYF